MNTDSDSPKRPWEPITFKGVAGFAQAPLRRLLAVELVVALGVAICTAWFVATAWTPVFTAAIARLPEESVIRGGKLEWPDTTPATLAEESFLSIHVDPHGSGQAGQVADLQLEFRAQELRLQSIFGYATIPYPHGWIILLNRAKLEPWWGAWRPAVVAGAGVGAFFGLLTGWAFLALAYAFAVRLLSLYANRQITWLGCWKLASAALMPGALLVIGAILLYGLQRLSLVGLLLAGALHLLVGWAYLAGAPLCLPRIGAVLPPGANPFARPAAPGAVSEASGGEAIEREP